MTETAERPVILVADDDPDMLEMVAFRLERAGSRSSARATARRLYSGCPSVPPTSRCWT